MLTGQFERAISHARQKFAGKFRKDGSGAPYFSHLLGVAALVLEYGGDETVAIAALLHDHLEDTATPAAELREMFGDDVVEVVLGCTEKKTISNWFHRKQEYLDRLRTASPGVRLVVAADKLHNLRSLSMNLRREGEAIWSRFASGEDGAMWFYRAVYRELDSSWDHPILAAIEQELSLLGWQPGAE